MTKTSSSISRQGIVVITASVLAILLPLHLKIYTNLITLSLDKANSTQFHITRSEGKFLQITDLHVDPYYQTGSRVKTSCHINTTKKSKKKNDVAGPLGDRECDSPIYLIESTLEWIKTHHGNEIDFVVYTGDSARHDSDNQIRRTRKEVYETNQLVANIMFDSFSHLRKYPNQSVPVIPTFGNNDIYPHNILYGGSEGRKVFKKFLDIWRPFIPEDQRHTFAYGGYFANHVVPGHLKVISLNTIYFYNSNAAVHNCRKTSSPGHKQLIWLEAELKQAKKQRMKVVLVGHIPPSRKAYYNSCLQMYSKLALEYNEIITSHLYGHMNMDHFIVIGDDVTTIDNTIAHDDGVKNMVTINRDIQRYLNALRESYRSISHISGKSKHAIINISPSIIPKMNPTYRIFRYESNQADMAFGRMYGYTQWYSNLTFWNRNQRDIVPTRLYEQKVSKISNREYKNLVKLPHMEYEVEYDTLNDYEMSDLTIDSWLELAGRLSEDDIASEKLWRSYTSRMFVQSLDPDEMELHEKVMSQNEKGKSKASECGNPLLRDWLAEWMEQAQGMQSKAYFTYRKAYNSMATYPTAFDHPSEAVKLHGIGNGLAMKLEKRMHQYCDENNLPRPERVKSKTKRTHSQMTGQANDTEQTQGTQNKTRAKRKPAMYIPRYRSGAYGIMIALYENAEKYGSQSRLSKEEIIALGQHHSDSSYDMLEAGKSYTAWSSMKTLLDKGYIWKQGSPPRYTLTDTGKAMAAQLQKVAQDNNQETSLNNADNSNSSKQPINNYKSAKNGRTSNGDDYTNQPVSSLIYPVTPTNAALSQSMSEIPNTQETYIISSDEDDADLAKPLGSQSSTPNKNLSSSFTLENVDHVNTSNQNQTTELDWYSYVDMSDQIVSKCYEADVLFNESTFEISYKIKFLANEVPKEFTSKIKFLDHTEDGFCLGYINEVAAKPYSPDTKLHQSSQDIDTSNVDKSLQNVASQVTEGDEDPQALSSDDLWTLQQQVDDNYYHSDTQTELFDLEGGKLNQFEIPPSQISEISIEDFPNESQSLSQVEAIPTLSQSLVEDTTRDFESIICKSYPPGSFKIVLVLDTREVKSRRDRDYIQDKLQQRGINVLVCALELGDVVWIAQKVNDQGPPDDLFLDFILERKRMDDLVASIKDGRFLEQKYRLKKAAAKQVFYLIEEFNKDEALRFGQSAIQTALAKTQVVDGFFVKHTASIDESIEYLERLTNLVKATYEVHIYMIHAKTIYQIPSSAVDKSDYIVMKRYFNSKSSDQSHLISYSLFNQLSSKSGTLTLEDMFARFLMTIRGVSAEKAFELKKTFQTPYMLMKAFDDCVDAGEEKFLAKRFTSSSIPRRRWGPSLSKKLWGIWRAKEY
ncbi:hypothetical protein INT43_001358 [Umbelopsis isabellina]|uniref:ERCC4 domain-containing protein n=1 Tax=Mortierella isabellina TaxID=91625 RepID=A0A8H7PM28_MORIS|nr:hypothetical protein INT43_001358 [Umbelopsis isabellina]